jgi:hypothetical protein
MAAESLIEWVKANRNIEDYLFNPFKEEAFNYSVLGSFQHPSELIALEDGQIHVIPLHFVRVEDEDLAGEENSRSWKDSEGKDLHYYLQSGILAYGSTPTAWLTIDLNGSTWHYHSSTYKLCVTKRDAMNMFLQQTEEIQRAFVSPDGGSAILRSTLAADMKLLVIKQGQTQPYSFTFKGTNIITIEGKAPPVQAWSLNNDSSFLVSKVELEGSTAKVFAQSPDRKTEFIYHFK